MLGLGEVQTGRNHLAGVAKEKVELTKQGGGGGPIQVLVLVSGSSHSVKKGNGIPFPDLSYFLPKKL